MKIVDMKIKEYMDILKTDEPAPGGGSVSGVTAAQGIALTLMVLELTIGKEKYKEYEEKNIEIRGECIKLYNELLNAADADKEAFIKLSKGYKLPKSTDEEKQNRKEVIGKLSLAATKAPFEVIIKSYDALKLTEKIVGKSNKMASSDLGVAAACLEAAAKSAWLNVKINLPYLIDEDYKTRFEKEGKDTLDKIKKLSKQIYEEVKGAL